MVLSFTDSQRVFGFVSPSLMFRIHVCSSVSQSHCSSSGVCIVRVITSDKGSKMLQMFSLQKGEEVFG